MHQCSFLLHGFLAASYILPGLGYDAQEPVVDAAYVGDLEVMTPGKGTPDRVGICDALREHFIRPTHPELMDDILWVVEKMPVSGDFAYFNGKPILSSGGEVPDNIRWQNYQALLEREDGSWKVIASWMGSILTKQEAEATFRSLPANFPLMLVPLAWRPAPDDENRQTSVQVEGEYRSRVTPKPGIALSLRERVDLDCLLNLRDNRARGFAADASVDVFTLTKNSEGEVTGIAFGYLVQGEENGSSMLNWIPGNGESDQPFEVHHLGPRNEDWSDLVEENPDLHGVEELRHHMIIAG